MAYDSKSWYSSKTLWINLLSFISGIALWAQGQIEVGSALTIAGAVNFSLRWISSKEIQL
jgi:hypothetical protein